MAKLLLATQDAFTKSAEFIARGQVVSADQVDWEEGEPGFVPAPEGLDANAVVEVSALSPTGPNPKNPQQIAPGTIQTAAGYIEAGARLVGEVTVPEKVRLADAGIKPDDDTQGKVVEALAEADQKEAEERARTAAERASTDDTVATERAVRVTRTPKQRNTEG